MALVLLEQDGKLSLEDDIRRYRPATRLWPQSQYANAATHRRHLRPVADAGHRGLALMM
jgi:CubicO group peptidase (beta-lactamase class C family)